MITLSLDPGFSGGFSLFDNDKLIHTESIELPKTTKKKPISQETKLFLFYDKLCGIPFNQNIPHEIRTEIDVIVIEHQFKNVMCQIVGISRMWAGKNGIECFTIPPASWKMNLLGKGHGNASKEEVRAYVVNVYPKLISCSENEVDSVGMYLGWRKKSDSST